MTRTGATPMPPEPRTAAGDVRRLGVELEFAGLDIEAAAAIVERELGGAVDVVSDYERRVRDTVLGDFNVELDFQYLKSLGRDEDLPATQDGSIERVPERLVAEIARRLVPLEVVSPPIDMDRTAELEPLVGALRDAGARGTRHSPLYAFGLHLNPEMPGLGAETITAYLRAFLCLYDWLAQVSEVDWSRRVTPYINPFPVEYVRDVVAPGYAPSLDGLADDYLACNADRNRALDLLPLLAHLDEKRVRAAIDDPRIKPRPTLHYRLPNCDIDVARWGIHVPWGHWLEVERLACDRARLDAIASAYGEHLDHLASRAFGDWAGECERWLDGGAA